MLPVEGKSQRGREEAPVLGLTRSPTDSPSCDALSVRPPPLSGTRKTPTGRPRSLTPRPTAGWDEKRARDRPKSGRRKERSRTDRETHVVSRGPRGRPPNFVRSIPSSTLRLKRAWRRACVGHEDPHTRAPTPTPAPPFPFADICIPQAKKLSITPKGESTLPPR